MHGEVREVEEERAVLIRFDELLGAAAEIVGEIVVGEARLQAGDVVRREIRRRRALLRAADVEREALLLRKEALAAKVPFADGGGGVAFGRECLGQRDLAQWK